MCERVEKRGWKEGEDNEGKKRRRKNERKTYALIVKIEKRITLATDPLSLSLIVEMSSADWLKTRLQWGLGRKFSPIVLRLLLLFVVGGGFAFALHLERRSRKQKRGTGEGGEHM